MDYIFFSSIAHLDISSYMISYDIACQWFKNLWSWMSSYLSCMQVDCINCSFMALAPKFHLNAHVEVCQTAFSFNLTPGVSWKDGEAPERGWANTNRLTSSIKEISQRDILDDHFGDWNWKKNVAMGVSTVSCCLLSLT